jgi:hypothetical protein
VRYYLERDPEFEPKMAEILCVYQQVAMMRCQAECGENRGQDSGGGSLAIVSYDEKPGIQAIGRPRRIARHFPALARPRCAITSTSATAP